MRSIIAALLLLGLLVSSAALAQEQDFVTLLVPIFLGEPVPGAHGSLWDSTLRIRNAGPEKAQINGDNGNCGGLLCPNTRTVPPFATVLGRPVGGGDGRPGALLTIHRDDIQKLTFALHIRDLSRQDQTWGTQIPVVTEDDLVDERPLTLLGIPIADRFRHMVRIYQPKVSQAGDGVTVRIYAVHDLQASAATPDVLLGEVFVSISPPPLGLAWAAPGYAEIADVSALVNLTGTATVNVEIEPIHDQQRIWAFVSVTNNETQHVTTITPR